MIEIDMPRYQSHKKVWALKIREIERDLRNQTWTIVPSDVGYDSFEVPEEYIQKHSPVVGGYYVAYGDGYKSFSPPKAFEEGYILCPKT